MTFFEKMKREKRITSTIEFQSIMKNKKFVTNGSFVVYTKVKRLDLPRVGVSVSKKLGSAVARNKIKRQVRMMLQNVYQDGFQFDSVIIVRKEYIDKQFKENEKLLENVLNKVKL